MKRFDRRALWHHLVVDWGHIWTLDRTPSSMARL